MLIHPQNFNPMNQFRQGLENDLGQQPFTDYFHRTGPLVDIYETMDEVVVSCEIPGLQKKDDVEIQVTDRQLLIHGIIQRASTGSGSQDNRYHRTERYFGQFQREVTLPDKVVEESAKASYKNGVLEIHMKKAQPHQGRKIEVDFQH